MWKTLIFAAAFALACTAAPLSDDPDAHVGGYILVTASRNGELTGLKRLQALAANAATLPVNRVYISFFSPVMIYEAGSKTLANVGLNLTASGDFGYAELAKAVQQFQSGGVEVFLSMGGWNYNCFPYMYARYSVGGYGDHTPNYWKIEQYGQGDINNCNEQNQFCWVCEPPSENTTLNDFTIFPEIEHSDVFQQAAKYIQDNYPKGNVTPAFAYDMVPGRPYVDKKTGQTVRVPGNDEFVKQNRDPYGDFVTLAKELGCDGVDLDYEEFWHADYFKNGTDDGPWTLPQSVYKYSAIVKTFLLHIEQQNAELKLSTAAGAVGAWSSHWWGGNLKGLWFYTNQWFPDLVKSLTTGPTAGGINVMTYDLSKNQEFHECPDEDDCPLDKQVAFYMARYKEAGIPANVGYEIGTPAYPAPDHDPSHQLPLTKEAFASILSTVQTESKSGFFWELYKPVNGTDEVTAQDLAQQLCKTLTPGSRCSGTIPDPGN